MPYRLELPCSEIGRVGEKEVDFLDSSFFTTKPGHRSLPTPAEVIARSPKFHTHPSPPPVRFEHLDLIVKCGPYVVVEEALCLRMLQKTFAKKVPVPEVYGWRVEGRDVFIYMELIRGETLQDRWDHLTDQERSSICGQLKEIVSTFRKVEQDPTDPFIGSVSRGRLLDYVLENMPSAGPFKSIQEFNDWFSALPQRWLPDSSKYQDPYREYLPDDGKIKFTHGDLHRGNIIISPGTNPRILAVIDWTHAGWYPEYWEYCKALYTAHYNGDWRNVWIPTFLDHYTVEFDVFAEYVLQMGAV
ncbi:hypothetical protein MauCBS54593_000335 [Microsporum audouinii]